MAPPVREAHQRADHIEQRYVCIYIYMCIYVYTYIHICICIHTYIHICIHIYRNIYCIIYVYIHTHPKKSGTGSFREVEREQPDQPELPNLSLLHFLVGVKGDSCRGL